MIHGFRFLQKALDENSELKEIVFDYYSPEYLTILDKLFYELHEPSCKRVDVKVAETSSDLIGFQSLISELEFAKYFANNRMQVELMSYDAFEGRKVPDFYAYHNSIEYFVEVKSILYDETDFVFGKNIAEILNSKGLSFMVVVKTSSLIATPTYLYEKREEKEEYISSALKEFKEKLNSISINHFPFVISTEFADVELHKTSQKKSYLGIGAMQSAIHEPPDYRERIRYDVVQKAIKRNDWRGDELNKFYIVAIDDDCLFFYIDRYNVELFGNATTYLSTRVPEVTVSPEIKHAIELGWEQYLRKMCVIRNERTVIPEDGRGLFFTNSLTRNISAVLVKHRNTFYLLGNPLAEKRINNPAILTDFHDCLLGWE